ncbi:MAG TPA: hypothetical protein VMZ04_05010 [Anaerolineae bacterium]|nr:hypothetical protein [Anaerolineae bacterium]
MKITDIFVPKGQNRLKNLLFLLLAISFMYAFAKEDESVSNQIIIKPLEYEHALRNPLKGFRGGYSDKRECFQVYDLQYGITTQADATPSD